MSSTGLLKGSSHSREELKRRGEMKGPIVQIDFFKLHPENIKMGGKEEFLKVYSGFCSSVLMPRKRRWNDSPLICFRFHCWGAQESIVKVKIQVDIVQQYKTNLIHFSAESWLVQKIYYRFLFKGLMSLKIALHYSVFLQPSRASKVP